MRTADPFLPAPTDGDVPPVDGHQSIAEAVKAQAPAVEPAAPPVPETAAPEAAPAPARRGRIQLPTGKVTVAQLLAAFGQAVAVIEELETEVQELKARPAAGPAPKPAPSRTLGVELTVLAKAGAKAECPEHKTVTTTLTGHCPKCLNEARRQAAIANNGLNLASQRSA